MDDTNPRKRPRPVVSCLRCRDKKLKCDRSSPCENCVKAQIAGSCTYQRDIITTSKEPSYTSTATANSVKDLQSRLAKVEEMLGIRNSKPLDLAEEKLPHAIGTVVVKGNRSIFHGQNDRTTLLNQFLEVKEFINDMSKDKQVQASAKQIKFLQNKSRRKLGSPECAVDSDFSVALLKLREYLPPKPYCDRLVAIYCHHFERTFRVLHIPTFTRRYDQIWTHEHNNICNTSSVIPELTAVLTMAYHMDDAYQFGDDQNHRTYLKGAAIDLIQSWLDELSRKQRTEISTLQVEVLLLLSKSLRGIHPEKLWSATGALVRSAIVMGLNVDPALVSGITPYMAEMRRRLWATILEADLQASMFCGMPLVVPDLNLNSMVPSNIDDAVFDEGSADLPASQPTDIYTDSLYQVILASSLPQRMRALSYIQQPAPDIQEGMLLGQKAEDCLLQKPQIMKLHNTYGAPIDGGSLLHRVLLDLYMRRPVLRLYKALLLDHQTHNATSKPLLAVLEKYCLDSSQVILSYQDLYTIPALINVTSSPWAHQNFFYDACKMDVLWAALTLCQAIKQHLKLGTPKADYDSQTLVRSVETTVKYLVNRIGQKGSDLKDIVFLALVLRSVQIPDCVADKSQSLQQTAKYTLLACREKLLQPLVDSEPHLSTAQPADRKISTSTSGPIPNIITPPMSNSSSTPLSLAATAFPLDLQLGSDNFFGDLSDLAVEFTAFQTDAVDANDPLNFGIVQNFDWERMWQ